MQKKKRENISTEKNKSIYFSFNSFLMVVIPIFSLRKFKLWIPSKFLCGSYNIWEI